MGVESTEYQYTPALFHGGGYDPNALFDQKAEVTRATTLIPAEPPPPAPRPQYHGGQFNPVAPQELSHTYTSPFCSPYPPTRIPYPIYHPSVVCPCGKIVRRTYGQDTPGRCEECKVKIKKRDASWGHKIGERLKTIFLCGRKEKWSSKPARNGTAFSLGRVVCSECRTNH